MERTAVRELKKVIVFSFIDFCRAFGVGSVSFFDPLLYFLIWLEKLLVGAPWPIVIFVFVFIAWIGSEAIAAINVVLPVSFFIAALGMSIGVGGGSIISRSLGEKNISKAEQTFGNQITLTLILTVLLVIFGLLFANQIIPLFGGKGSVWNAILGALVIGSLGNGLDLSGASAADKLMFSGGILLLAVSIDALSRRDQNNN